MCSSGQIFLAFAVGSCHACSAQLFHNFSLLKTELLSQDSLVQSKTQASCTISEARSLGSGALIMAHELAHNMGVDHDGEGVNADCDGGHDEDGGLEHD